MGDTSESTIEPALPGLELPEYHGRPAEGMKSSLTGAGNRIVAAHDIGQRGVAVVEFEVTGSGHKAIAKKLFYVEALTVLDVFEVQGPAAARLLSSMRESYRTDEDTRLGRTPLAPGMGDEHHADESGNILTPPDLAAVRGDPVAAMLDERVAPVVVVYSDGAREMWPDEFGKDAPRPAAGEMFEVEVEGARPVYVERLLNAETGETVAEWTREQEDARLLAMEQAAMWEEGGVEPGSLGGDDDQPSSTAPVPSDDPDTDWLDGAPLGDRPPMDAYTGGDGYVGEVVGIDVAARKAAEPGPDDFALVDRTLTSLLEMLPNVHSSAVARRLVAAEQAGRGRGLKPRAGVVAAIERRIASLDAP